MSARQPSDEQRLRAVFRALKEQGVEYAVFGAVALGLHGLARATADVDLFIAPDAANVERLKAALRAVFKDPNIEDIAAEDLCGDYPAVRYYPPEGFGFDILTRLGDAFRYTDLDIEEKNYDGVPVRVVTPRTLWRVKKDTTRPTDRFDAESLPRDSGSGRSSVPVTRYRSIEEMPRPWRDPDDPGNLRVVAQMLTFYRSLVQT